MLTITWLRSLLAAAALVLVACAGDAPAAPPQSERARLLGAIPPDAAARGVYVVDLDTAGDLSPGSRIAPLVAPLAEDAEWLVETGGEPLTLLGGVPDDVPTPEMATRAGEVLIIGAPEARQAAVDRLEDGAVPQGSLAELAAADEPVGWAGPTPSPDGQGTTVITLADDRVRFATETEAPGAAAADVQEQLETGGPVGSPGKRWSSVLGDPEVTTEGNRLVITAVPEDLPGLFLRVLVDQRQITFLPA